MTTVYDAAIVGAGPGGSNAAAVMLRHGLSVVQFDAARFPRVKPCGGGLTMKARHALQLSLRPVATRTFTDLEANAWCGRTRRFSHRAPLLTMVFRPQFDNSLVEQNRQSPEFTFFDSEKVRSVAYERVFRVSTDTRTIWARQLIGADGAYSLVAKTFGFPRPRAFATAIELNLRAPGHPAPDHLAPCFDFGAIEQGYGWVFPKDGHLNVGLYTFARGLKHLRTLLLEYLTAKGIVPRADDELRFEAQQIPVGGFALRMPRKAPVYIVGDAGGFADALSGEGIFAALESGRLAGLTAVEHARGQADVRQYSRRLWRSVLPDTLLTYELSRFFYRHPDLSVRAMQSPLLWRPLVEGTASGATVARSLALGGYYALSSLVQRTTQCESV